MNTFEPRTVRCFSIYKSQHLVLTVADEPGRLLSTAAPPPEGAPAHSFVNARAYDPFSEGELAWHLQKAANFDDFIGRLIQGGYDVASQYGTPPTEMSDASRLEDETGLAGAMWSTGGQFTTLIRQPQGGDCRFSHATLTAYHEARAEVFLSALAESATFAELRAKLREAGFRVIALPLYTI